MFDESVSWYLPLTPRPDSNPSSDEEVSEAEMPPDEPEIEIESPISLRLSGPSGRLSRFDQSEEETASCGDSVVHSPRRKLRRRLTRKEKVKKKMSEYSTDKDELDRSKSDSAMNKDGPPRLGLT